MRLPPWRNLDYFNKTIYVDSTLRINGTEGPPKTAYSQRYLALRPEVVAAFKRQEKRSRMASEYIFPNPYTLAQRYPYLKAFQKQFAMLLQLAGLKDRNPNQLRHTFATLHIAAGENILWVAQMLGHNNVKTTLERYNQYIPNLTREDGSAFEKAFSERRNGYDLVMAFRE